MSDLIDLESPDGKKVTGSKLVSPLIPAPSKSPNDNKIESPTACINYVNRNSIDNNPFDNALHETVVYSRKQDDPFEVVHEKALNYNNTLKPSTMEDNLTLKKSKRANVLKMNKSLGDSPLKGELNNSKSQRMSLSNAETSIIQDLNDTNLLDEKPIETNTGIHEKFQFFNGRLVPKLCIDPQVSSQNSSILNNSAMNDSLIDSGDSSEENLLKSIVAQRISMCIRRGTDDANSFGVLDVPNVNMPRRSASQGDKLSPRKLRQHRSTSIVESLKIGMGNEDDRSGCSFNSSIFEDNMNKAFMQSRSSDNASTISDLSNISAIVRIPSVTSGCSSSNSSSACSNRTINRGFMDSSVSVVAEGKIDQELGSKKISLTHSSLKGSSMKDDISDLLDKYSKLKAKTSETESFIKEPAISRLPSIISGSGINNADVCEKIEDKLIDVDVFVPGTEGNSFLESNQQPSSNLSDSVFVENDTVEKSILSEAKILAKTFEELASKTSSSSASSTGEDLVNSRPQWNFDILPVSDDEVPVDDLIQLPISPAKQNSPPANNTFENIINVEKSSPNSTAKSEKSMLKELEAEFIAPEKKIVASTLLNDLEKLVKSEGNSEAIKLLENLEKALGVNRESNAELLAICFADRNDLTKSPTRSGSSLSNGNIKDDNNERSCEDNADVEFAEFPTDDKCHSDNFNIPKVINKSDKSLKLVSEKLDGNSSRKLPSMNTMDGSSENINDSVNNSINNIKERNQITDDQQLALELLMGLGKLLSGEKKDPMTANLLKNLGTALNLASGNNRSEGNETEEEPEQPKRLGTPMKIPVSTPPRKSVSISSFSRTLNRKSLEPNAKSKTSTERVMRRSFSVSQTPSCTTPRLPTTSLSLDKSKAHINEAKKRFSSDPGLINSSGEKTRLHLYAVQHRKSSKDISLKTVRTSELSKQDKPLSNIVETVKNKLKKKSEQDLPSKKGPMKALIPFGSMQRRVSIGKRVSPLSGSATPPKPIREPSPASSTVVTSTPCSFAHLTCPKKSPKSKPMASSTPDAIAPKNLRRSASQIPSSPGRNRFPCNISPVISQIGEVNEDKDSSQSLKSKICTPSKSHSSSQLPKLSPMLGMKSAPASGSRAQRRSEQSHLPLSLNPPKSPAISELTASTLNTSNKIASKVKPLNLISKFRRRSANTAEKENQT